MKKLYGSILFTVLLISSCKMTPTNPEETIIDKPTVELKGNRLTPELLWAFGRVGEVALSPDGQSILYSVKYYDVAENKGNSEIYLMNIDGSGKKQISHSAKSESNICWRPDGKKIAFLYSDDSGTQLWEMDPDGTNRKKISQVEVGITGFKFSPDQTKIVYSKEVSRTDKVIDRHPDLPKANAYLGNDLMIRHWDSWKDSHSHLFVADYTGESLLNAKDIMEGELFDSPKKPFGGMEQVAWSPDSKSLVYTSQKLSGAEYARSTNTDLYHYQLVTGQTNNLTQGMMGYDINPVFSPNGKYLAFESMEHDGYESDLNRLFILDLQTGSMTNCSDNFDQMVHGLAWDEKSENIYFTSDWHARYQVYEYNLLLKTYRALTQGDHNYQAVWYSPGKLVATKMSISMPTEVFSVDISNGTETQLSDVNSELLAKLNMGKVEERWVKTTDNKEMLVWVIYPPDFDSTKKYPALLYCQGGPQSSVSQFFSYRWNFQLMAANDYIVVAPNRRGLPSFGHEWNKQISGDYGGQNMKDYLSAIDALALEPFVDENRLGAVGASYGGFSVYWLAGNHQNRFKAFIAHDGIFNLQAQYLETEETFFVEWDLGGPYWDQSNRIAQRSYANSPHLFVDRWNTPIMVIHGEKDYRVLHSQGLQAYTAARLRGVPARYLHFPEENHWVLAPQNSILWHREFYIWLDQWLK